MFGAGPGAPVPHMKHWIRGSGSVCMCCAVRVCSVASTCVMSRHRTSLVGVASYTNANKISHAAHTKSLYQYDLVHRLLLLPHAQPYLKYDLVHTVCCSRASRSAVRLCIAMSFHDRGTSRLTTVLTPW